VNDIDNLSDDSSDVHSNNSIELNFNDVSKNEVTNTPRLVDLGGSSNQDLIQEKKKEDKNYLPIDTPSSKNKKSSVATKVRVFSASEQRNKIIEKVAAAPASGEGSSSEVLKMKKQLIKKNLR
jgi:hypothetical protein